SIRLSLMVYFLVLLAAALGTASLLVYRTARATLKEKENATGQLIQAQYRERCLEEENRLKEALLFQAQTLARLAQFAFDRRRRRHRPTRLARRAAHPARP